MAVDILIGSELAGYRIEALIGRGGMGVVYRAEHLLLGRRDALKVLAAEFAEDADYRERFLRESRLAAAIEHPNVIPIYHAGESEGLLYIAMRYVDGTDLRDLLKQEGPLDPSRTVAILEQVADALDAAHPSGLVHRDVKPANILIAQRDRVYLSDFGIAKHTATRGLTKTGSFVGTLDYSSPEQIEGRDLDGRADVYSLGCVACECLTGAVPYKKDSEVQVLYAHLLEPPPLMTSRRPELGAEVDTVIGKALAKTREERYETCSQLVAGLRRALARRAVSESRVRQVPAPPTQAASRREAFTPPTAPVEPVAAASAPAQPGPPPFAVPSAPARSRMPSRTWLAGAAVLALVLAGVLAAVLLTRGKSVIDPDVQKLRLRVPPAIRDTCATRSVPAGASAGVVCHSSGVTATYLAFRKPRALNRYYANQVGAAGLTPKTGTCGEEPFHGERPYTVKARPVGQAYCGTGQAGAFVGWTDNAARIYARASRSDGNQTVLAHWWAAAAGPLAAGARAPAAKSADIPVGTVIFRDAYRVTAGKAQPTQRELTTLSFRDVGIEVRARRVGGPSKVYSFGVVCRGGGESAFWLDVRSVDGLVRIRKAAGESPEPPLVHQNVGPLSAAGLDARCQGGGREPLLLSLSVNGGKALRYKGSSTSPVGAVGVVAQSLDGRKATVRFDDFEVTAQ